MTEATIQRLTNTLHRIRLRIRQIQDRRESIGEQNTKATLIDPVLAALGWDLEELDEVCREYKRVQQDNPVDYALFLNRVPCLFVEAKALEKDMSDRKWSAQVISYATVVGVEWCVLTNGDEYRIYNSHAPMAVEDKLFRKVRISDSSADEYLLDTLDLLSKDNMGKHRLKVLWKAQFIDRHVKQALEEMLTGEDDGLMRMIRKRTPEQTPAEIRDSLKRADIRIDYPIMPIIPQAETLAELSPILTEEEPQADKATGDVRKSPTVYGIEVITLIEAGMLNPPIELFRDYKKIRLSAKMLVDGRVSFNGELYDSLSTSASEARKTVIGAPSGRKYPQTNGWIFWKCVDPISGQEVEMDYFRKKLLKDKQ